MAGKIFGRFFPLLVSFLLSFASLRVANSYYTTRWEILDFKMQILNSSNKMCIILDLCCGYVDTNTFQLEFSFEAFFLFKLCC